MQVSSEVLERALDQVLLVNQQAMTIILTAIARQTDAAALCCNLADAIEEASTDARVSKAAVTSVRTALLAVRDEALSQARRDRSRQLRSA